MTEARTVRVAVVQASATPFDRDAAVATICVMTADAAAKGAAVLKSQNYDVLNQFASGDLLVLEFTWTGVLAVSIGSLSAGDTMRAHCTAVMELEAGRIRRLRNYDCFEAF